jgi:hypothetical protein
MPMALGIEGVYRHFQPFVNEGAAKALTLFVLGLPVSSVGVAVFWKLSSVQNQWDGETRCRKCGYTLRGISEPRCPECGERI